MKLTDMLEILEHNCLISLLNQRDAEVYEPRNDNIICITLSNSEGVAPYLDREVIKWGLTDKMATNAIDNMYFVLAPKKRVPETIDIGALAKEVVDGLQQEDE